MKPKNLLPKSALLNMGKKRNKYNAVKTDVDGWTFDSKAEAEYYTMLQQHG